MFVELAWWVPLAPLIVLPLVALLEYLRPNAGACVSIAATGVSLVISTGMLWETLNGATYSSKFTVFRIGNLELNYGVYVDALSAFMSWIVAFISFWVLVFSIEYMSHEREKSRLALPRYWVEITLFVGSMLGLVLSYSLFQLYIFWELVGFCSWALIGYWWDDPHNAWCATEAIVVTRFGDVFFMATLVICAIYAGTLDIPVLIDIEKLRTLVREIPLGLFCALVALTAFVGAMGKSAQLPFSIWLPNAMAGPTTVSALIHAATMVKAGVYLVARLYPIYLHADPVSVLGVTIVPLHFVAWVGVITGVWAGIIAIFSRDIKRVLAFSTVSHLGFMFFALGIGAFVAAMFHLLAHAFFKALLFLSAGSVLHATHETKDIFKLGGLASRMPITATTALIGALSIAGIPGFVGGFSKHEILCYAAEYAWNTWLLVLAFVLAITSSFYIFRWWFVIFTGRPRSHVAEEAHEMPWLITVPLIVLAFGCCFLGAFNYFTHFLENLFAHLPSDYMVELTHHSVPPEVYAWSATGISFLAIPLTALIYWLGKIPPESLTRPVVCRAIYKFFLNETYLDKAVTWFSRNVLAYGFARAVRWFDENIIDGAYRGLAWFATGLSRVLRRPQATGLVNYYAVAALIGLGALLLALLLSTVGALVL